MIVIKVRMVMRSRMITIFTSQSHKREQSQVSGSPSNLISFKEDGRRAAGREVQPRWEKSNTWWRDVSLMKPSLRERWLYSIDVKILALPSSAVAKYSPPEGLELLQRDQLEVASDACNSFLLRKAK